MDIFDYSHSKGRVHGPEGYRNYQSFKPWLRDEFSYRCAYCLCREKWFPDGDVSFGADHLAAVSLYPELETNYENLVYSCCHCNSLKSDSEILQFDQGRAQLFVDQSGIVFSEQIEGKDLIEICRLNRPSLISFRNGILEVVELYQSHGRDTSRFLGYPESLPNLALLKPPAGNTKPEGIQNSAYHRKCIGELPSQY